MKSLTRNQTIILAVISVCTLCCVLSLVITAIDTGLRSVGLLPTQTPRPTKTSTLTPTNTPIPTDTPIPTNTLEPTLTPIPTNVTEPTLIPLTSTPEPNPTQEESIASVTSDNDVNIRSGPSTDYNVVGTLAAGESLDIVGRNAASSWWQVSTPNV